MLLDGYIISADGEQKPIMKSWDKITVFIVALGTLLIVLALVTVLLMGSGGASGDNTSNQKTGDPARERTLSEVPGARFLSIFVSDANGGLASYMVGGKTDEFQDFTEAVAAASQLDGFGDETFEDLLVFSFGENDTLEMSYSRTLNRFILGDRVYQPSGNLAPMIDLVEKKFSNQ